jgi:hypothetical protein
VNTGASASTWTTAATTTISYPTASSYYGGISVDRLDGFYVGTAAYSDLVAGLRPGTAWFKQGSTLKLQNNIFLYDKQGGYLHSIATAGSIFVYFGVVEDLVMGKERHWFFASDGQIVQYYHDIGNLGWRAGIKYFFKEVEDSNGNAAAKE